MSNSYVSETHTRTVEVKEKPKFYYFDRKNVTF